MEPDTDQIESTTKCIRAAHGEGDAGGYPWPKTKKTCSAYGRQRWVSSTQRWIWVCLKMGDPQNGPFPFHFLLVPSKEGYPSKNDTRTCAHTHTRAHTHLAMGQNPNRTLSEHQPIQPLKSVLKWDPIGADPRVQEHPKGCRGHSPKICFDSPSRARHIAVLGAGHGSPAIDAIDGFVGRGGGGAGGGGILGHGKIKGKNEFPSCSGF